MFAIVYTSQAFICAITYKTIISRITATQVEVSASLQKLKAKVFNHFSTEVIKILTPTPEHLTPLMLVGHWELLGAKTDGESQTG